MPGARLLALSLTLLLGACTLPWSSPPPVERAAGRTPVRTARVARGDIAGVLLFAGDLRAKPAVTATSRISGRLERLHVEPGSTVREGDTVAELDRAAIEVQVVQNQANLAAAEARLAGLQTGDDPDARAEAEARLRAARARLEALENGPRAEAIPQLAQNLRDARRQLADLEGNNGELIGQAEARLASARGRLDQMLTAGPSASLASPIPLDRAGLELARADVRRAEEDLARARRPITGEEVAAARQQVAQAEDELLLARNPVGPGNLEEARANVEAAEARMRRAGAPAAPATVKAAESAVEYAWAALELARLQLREATIPAPIGGIVGETHQRPGVSVAAGAPLVTIQPHDYELVVAIEERQLGQVTIGQGVNITAEAYPGESFSGTIRSIAPVVDTRARTVAAKIDVLDPQVKLKAGLFAQAAIAGPRRQGVLLAPREAVIPGPEPSVLQVVDGRARRHPIQTGASDGRSVEVQGLPEGAELVVNPAGVADGDVLGTER